MALGVGQGDEGHPPRLCLRRRCSRSSLLVGAKPVFADIDAHTCNIDAALIKDKITDKTRAIIPVSLYGQPADMDAINAIAARHGNIPVIEDAAQSFGASLQGSQDAAAWAPDRLHQLLSGKPLGCHGGNSAIFTSDDAIAQACREIRVHGQSGRYLHTRIGVGGRMDTIQCAVVLAKLERFDQEMATRRAIAQRQCSCWRPETTA